ncbi:MAG: radical SAM protein, partial [Trebonia sp.]
MAAPQDVLPFRQFVLKVHSRCDLACDHCYVYEHADQSWRGKPTVISAETVARTADRIAEHVGDHHLSGVRVILHGGEPLLAGAARLAAIIRGLRRAIDPVCRLDLRIHTNGVRLDAELCELFLAERVRVGISLDGDRAANDLHRRYANGRSSYDQVVRAITLLRRERFHAIYAGLLATIDVRSDPVAVYRALAALEPPNLDFLLPHATWDNPPPRIGEPPVGEPRVGEHTASRPRAGQPVATSYADWLIAV